MAHKVRTLLRPSSSGSCQRGYHLLSVSSKLPIAPLVVPSPSMPVVCIMGGFCSRLYESRGIQEGIVVVGQKVSGTRVAELVVD